MSLDRIVFPIIFIQVHSLICTEAGTGLTRFSRDDYLYCNNSLYNRSDFYPYNIKCCGGNNKIYREELEFCCGTEIRNKSDFDGNEYGCCEKSNRPYKLTGEDGICCDDILHEGKTYEKYGCCGNKTFKWLSNVCCESKIHYIEANSECCGSELFNIITHECVESIIMPRHIRYCGKYRIDIRDQICCGEKTYNGRKTDSRNLCCGDRPYNPDMNDCLQGRVVQKGDLLCGEESFHPSSKDCCNGVIHVKYSPQEFCCGDNMINFSTTGCCGTSSLPFDRLNQKCCGGTVIDGSEKCCGDVKLNPETEVCCPSIFGYKEHKIGRGQKQTKCCPNKYGGQGYDEHTQICTRRGNVKTKPKQKILMCGRTSYTPTTDLCCNYKLYKNYKKKGFKCCLPGSIVFYPKTHSCCNGVPKKGKRCFHPYHQSKRKRHCASTCKRQSLKLFISKRDCNIHQYYLAKKNKKLKRWVVYESLPRKQKQPTSKTFPAPRDCSCRYKKHQKVIVKVNILQNTWDFYPGRSKYVKKMLKRLKKICHL